LWRRTTPARARGALEWAPYARFQSWVPPDGEIHGRSCTPGGRNLSRDSASRGPVGARSGAIRGEIPYNMIGALPSLAWTVADRRACPLHAYWVRDKAEWERWVLRAPIRTRGRS